MFLRTLFCGQLSDLVRQELVCYAMPEFDTNRSEVILIEYEGAIFVFTISSMHYSVI